MKKVILMVIFFTLGSVLFAGSDKSNSIFVYIPQENEIQYYMNLYEKLKNIENSKLDSKDLISFYDTFLQQQKYRDTYQSLLFESYLLCTQNENVKNLIITHIKNSKYQDDFSKALVRLYSSKKEQVAIDKNKQIRYNFQNQFFDENINLFYMKEVTTFNKELGIMFFDNNNWNQIAITDKDLKKNSDQKNNSISFIYGGGTNSICLTLDKYNIPDYKNFLNDVINSKFYKEKYNNYKLNELPNQGILSRSGADKINIGIGYGKDHIPEIESFSVVLYMYSNIKKCGYVITYFINYSKINNSYEFRNRIYNHLIFQILLTWINI